MPAVLVHGVPDTPRVWQTLVARLARRDVVQLSLPGFGSPVPDGFDASKEAYVDWLLAELAALPSPIDLVGHDWGSLLAVRAVSLQPAIARSWVGGAAPVDSEYEWHPTAQMWQTPGVGEALMEQITPDAMREGLVAAGVPAAAATETASHVDDLMKRCILALYRSAVHASAEWEGDLCRITAPGLVLWGEDDPYAAPRFGARLAERTGARFVSYPATSHWWQLERPAEVAAELERFWATL